MEGEAGRGGGGGGGGGRKVGRGEAQGPSRRPMPQKRKRPAEAGEDGRKADGDGSVEHGRRKRKRQGEVAHLAEAPKHRHGSKPQQQWQQQQQHHNHQLPLNKQPGSSADLLRFLGTVMPGYDRLETVDTCLEHVRLLVRQLCGDDAAVVVQGSYTQGVALVGSDLDVAVILDGKQQAADARRPGQQRGGASGRQRQRSPSAGRGTARRQRSPSATRGGIEEMADSVDKRRAVALLKRLAEAIAGLGSSELRVALRIFSAQVPVLRLHGSASGGGGKVVIDISVGASLFRGACDRCVHRLLRADGYGISAALCRLVKVWAKRRRLSETVRGGLSSFSFVLLVIFFLQNLPQPRMPPYEAISSSATVAGTEGSCSEQHAAPGDASEGRVAALLKEFFTWAVEKLPEYSRHSLSVVSGKAEPRRGGAAGLGRKPVLVEVPFKPEDNAARCLRASVWEGSIRPEFERAQRLAAQIVEGSGRQKAFAVRTLFAQKGGAKDVDFEDPASEGRTGAASCGNSSAVDSDGGAGDGVAPGEFAQSSGRRKLSKKRRLGSNSWIDHLVAMGSPTLVPLNAPPALAAASRAGGGASAAPPPQSLNMWLGLRAALSGDRGGGLA